MAQGFQVVAVQATSLSGVWPWPVAPFSLVDPRPAGLGVLPWIPMGKFCFISLQWQVLAYPSLLALRASWSRRAAGVDIPSEHRPLAAGRPRRLIPGRIPPTPRSQISRATIQVGAGHPGRNESDIATT